MADFPVVENGPPPEPTRKELVEHPLSPAELLQRTRRIFRLARRPGPLKYARGLDSKPSDFA